MASNGEKENEDLLPPGQYPTVDWQGTSLYCTSFAVAKALCSFFQKKGRDLKQDIVAACLYNKHNGNNGKWPTDYDGETFRIIDKEGDVCTIKVAIKKGIYSYEKEHVLVSKDDTVGRHSMYLVKEYTAKHGEYKGLDVYQCMNSWGAGEKPFPEIHVESNVIEYIYEVGATWTVEPLYHKKEENNGTENQEMVVDEAENGNSEMDCPNGDNIKSQSSAIEKSYAKRKKKPVGLKRSHENNMSQSTGNEKSSPKTPTRKKKKESADGLKHTNGDNSRLTGIRKFFGNTPTKKDNDEAAEGVKLPNVYTIKSQSPENEISSPNSVTRNLNKELADDLKHPNEDNINTQPFGIEQSSPKTPTTKNESSNWIAGYVEDVFEYDSTFRFTVVLQETKYLVDSKDKTRYEEILDLKRSNNGVLLQHIPKTPHYYEFSENTTCNTVPDELLQSVYR